MVPAPELPLGAEMVQVNGPPCGKLGTARWQPRGVYDIVIPIVKTQVVGAEGKVVFLNYFCKLG